MARKTQAEKEADKAATAAAQQNVKTQFSPADKPENPAPPKGVSKREINERARPR